MPSTSSHPASKEGVLNERDPDLWLTVDKRGAKARRHDSNDGERTLVEDHRASKDLWICSQAPAPQILAHDYDGRSAALAVLRKKNAPLEWLHIEKRKVLRRHDTGVHLGRLATSRECEWVKINCRELAKNMILRSPLFKIRIRSAGFWNSFLGVRLKCGDQLIGIRVRQRLEEHGVNDAEDSSVGADAKSESEHGHSGEAGTLSQHTEGVACVLKKSFDKGQTAEVVIGFFQLRDAAEFDASSASGFFRRHASANIFVGEHIEMRFKLAREFLIHMARRKPCTHSRG